MTFSLLKNFGTIMSGKKENQFVVYSEKTIFPFGLQQDDILNLILKTCPDVNVELVQIISAKLQPIEFSQKFGLSGDYFYLNVSFQVGDAAEHNEKFFVKSLPINCPLERNRTKSWKLFDREKAMYVAMDKIYQQSEANDSFKLSPRTYVINDNFIIMENLNSAGFVSAANKNLPENQVLACISGLAQLHAQNISLRDQGGSKPKPVNILFEDDLFRMHDPWLLSGISAIRKLGLQDSRNQCNDCQDYLENEFIFRVLNALEQLKVPSKFLRVSCHCDLRPKNIFLKNEGNYQKNYKNIIFSDYQQARYLPPAVDLLLFLYYNLRQPFPNEEHLTKYINYYYEQLNNFSKILDFQLEKYLTYESFLESINHYKILALIMRALQAPFLCDPSYAVKLKIEDMFKYVHYMSTDRTEMIRNLCEMDADWKLFISESNQSLIEFLRKDQ